MQSERHRLGGFRVLVVDDEEAQASTLALLLSEEEDVLATSATDPRVALEQVETNVVDAIVIDVAMPGLSGPDLLALLRENNPGLPVVLLSGYERDDSRIASAMALGNIVYLAKPVNLDKVVAALVGLLLR